MCYDGTFEEKETLTTVRTRIKELRERYDLTQEDFAKKVGKYNSSLKLAREIAKALPKHLIVRNK